MPSDIAHRVTDSFGPGATRTGAAGPQPHAVVHDVRLAFAQPTQTVCYIMAGVMAVSFLVSRRWARADA